MSDDLYQRGLGVRREVLGEAHVERATRAITPFDADFQRFITEGAWGSVWSRPQFTRRERSIVTLALLAALGHHEEVALHVRATKNTGASPQDVAEAMLHVAVYAGVPAANHANTVIKQAYAAMAAEAAETSMQAEASDTSMAAEAEERVGRMDHEGSYYQRDRDWHPPAYTPNYKTSVLRSPKQALLSLDNTISEMTGPVFGHDMLGPLDDDLIRNWAKTGDAIGQRMIVHGRVLDENGRGLPGVLLEFWQANAGGRYRHHKETYHAALDPNFGGCGRAITGEDGSYRFRTVKPGAYPWPNRVNDWRPAHIHFSLFGHAFAQRLVTQMYFEGDPMIWQCPIVGTIPDKRAIEQLIAALDRRNTTHMDSLAYRFDIVLRGRRSTPFENRMEGN